MSKVDEFKGVSSRFRQGKEGAAEEIFARYVRRLTAGESAIRLGNTPPGRP